jgi:hypothetical protein
MDEKARCRKLAPARPSKVIMGPASRSPLRGLCMTAAALGFCFAAAVTSMAEVSQKIILGEHRFEIPVFLIRNSTIQLGDPQGNRPAYGQEYHVPLVVSRIQINPDAANLVAVFGIRVGELPRLIELTQVSQKPAIAFREREKELLERARRTPERSNPSGFVEINKSEYIYIGSNVE